MFSDTHIDTMIVFRELIPSKTNFLELYMNIYIAFFENRCK